MLIGNVENGDKIGVDEVVNEVGNICIYFFFNDTATTEIYTLSLHDALPIFGELLLIVRIKVSNLRFAVRCVRLEWGPVMVRVLKVKHNWFISFLPPSSVHPSTHYYIHILSYIILVKTALCGGQPIDFQFNHLSDRKVRATMAFTASTTDIKCNNEKTDKTASAGDQESTMETCVHKLNSDVIIMILFNILYN